MKKKKEEKETYNWSCNEMGVGHSRWKLTHWPHGQYGKTLVYPSWGGRNTTNIWKTVDIYVGQIGQYKYYRLIGSPLLYTLW